MSYKILVLKNSPSIDVANECVQATQFFASRPTPISVEFSFRNVNIPVDYKVYKTVQGFNSSTGKPMLVDYYGLVDSVKDTIRTLVKEGECNAVMFISDITSIPIVPGKSYPNWTNMQPLYFNTGFMQVVFSPYLKHTGEVLNAIKHEPMHDFCYALNRYGFSVLDEMDVDHLGRPYYRNDFPEDADSNFGFTFANIKPFIDKLIPAPLVLYKPKNFSIQELISPAIFQKFGDKAWEFFDARVLRNLQFLRDNLGAIKVNTATLFYRGFDAEEYRKDGVSQHNHGRAIDCEVVGMTSEQVRQWIQKPENASRLPEPNIWVEIGTPHFHFDVRYSDKKGVYLFNP